MVIKMQEMGIDIQQPRERQTMTEDEITAQLAEILNDVAGVDPAVVSVDKIFVDDLEVDSLSMVEVVMAAEDRFGVRIPDEDMAGLRTVGDAVTYIHRSATAN